jgi:hypothetical protein
MDPRDAVRRMEEKHEEIFFGFSQVLQQAGISDVDVLQFELQLTGYKLTCTNLTGGRCPEGQRAETTCVRLPDGTVKCTRKCVQA